MFRKLGVGISIDDFGTGYSSLSALADITADEIMIDRSLITDIHKRPRSQNVLKAIESLSAALGMSVVAEGIETYEELAYLQAATRIRYAQGFYFCKPLFIGKMGYGDDVALESRMLATTREIPEARGASAVEHRGREALAKSVLDMEAGAAPPFAARNLIRLELAELEPHRQRHAFAEGEALASPERGQEVQ